MLRKVTKRTVKSWSSSVSFRKLVGSKRPASPRGQLSNVNTEKESGRSLDSNCWTWMLTKFIKDMLLQKLCRNLLDYYVYSFSVLEIESLASWIWGKSSGPEPQLQLLPLIIFAEAGKRSRQGRPNHPDSTSLLSLLRLDTWTKIMYWRKGLFGFTVLKNMVHQHARRSTRWRTTQQHNLESREMSNGAQLVSFRFPFYLFLNPVPVPQGGATHIQDGSLLCS